MRQYDAIFFDWDGTAVPSRHADTSRIISAMEKILVNGTKLIIVSGTTYGNICSGKLEELLSASARQNLFLGLARGNFDYGYDRNGRLCTLTDATPDTDMMLQLHDAVYAIHRRLLCKNHFRTDIVFSRPNYCKLDLMVENSRSTSHLFLQANEINRIKETLELHGIEGGLPGLLLFAESIGSNSGLQLKATTDAKYLEVGYTTKSDNVDRLIDFLHLDPAKCCFWGDEYGAIAPGIWGSDFQMCTAKSKVGTFFSVSKLNLPLPEGIQSLGGGEERFVSFLEEYSAFL